MATSKQLTAVQIARLKEPGRYSDGGGLYLQVSKWKTKSWLFRYERDGRERQMGLGPVDIVSLADARERARAARRLLLDGLDPIDARKTERAALKLTAARTISFRECAEAYIAAHRASWKNDKHAAQWPATLMAYAYPVIGHLSAADIDTGLVLRVLEPIWRAKTETASRLRGRIEKILDWARVRGYRAGENPARWTGHLDQLLARKSKIARITHRPALPYAELPKFMAELRARKGASARALEFLILTAARTSEVIGARAPEFDFVQGTWTVPAERMKADREHRVPLVGRAIELVRHLDRVNEETLAFEGRGARPLSNMAMLELLRDMRPGFTVHGFRSTFKVWASETTDHENIVTEMALAHSVSDEVEAAYRRGDLFEKRRAVMRDWSKYCECFKGAKVRGPG